MFLETQKFDGTVRRDLRPAEIQQIAGRAGRYGLYNIGYCTSANHRKLVRSAMSSRNEQQKRAYIEFPRSLVGLEDPVSKTMRCWADISDEGIYEKATIETQIQLAKRMEAMTGNKDLVYQFSRFPIDPSKQRELILWTGMAQAAANGTKYEPSAYLGGPLKSELREHLSLSELEGRHKALDILYYYKSRFEPERFQWVLQRKAEVSAEIIRLLDQHRLEPRECSVCGKKLPWNYPYGMCNRCYRAMTGREKYDWYDGD